MCSDARTLYRINVVTKVDVKNNFLPHEEVLQRLLYPNFKDMVNDFYGNQKSKKN